MEMPSVGAPRWTCSSFCPGTSGTISKSFPASAARQGNSHRRVTNSDLPCENYSTSEPVWFGDGAGALVADVRQLRYRHSEDFQLPPELCPETMLSFSALPTNLSTLETHKSLQHRGLLLQAKIPYAFGALRSEIRVYSARDVVVAF
jgi:hypothetical protein